MSPVFIEERSLWPVVRLGGALPTSVPNLATFKPCFRTKLSTALTEFPNVIKTAQIVIIYFLQKASRFLPALLLLQ